MAGIFLWNKTESFNPDEINRVFQDLDYRPGKHLEYNDWNVLVFPKSSYDICNYIIADDGIICGTGTFGYKGKVYEQALPCIYEDIRNNRLDLESFWGSFIIFCSIDGKSYLIRDGAMLARLHGIKSKPVYSSSFVGLLRCSKSKLNFDKEAATELLSTGLITGNSTIVKEIQFISDGDNLINLTFYHSKAQNLFQVRDRSQALDQQIQVVSRYLSTLSTDWFNYMPGSHFNISITGGLDSRLLTAFILKLNCKFDFYTYWRNSDSVDPDFKLAQIIAKYLGIRLNYKSIRNSDHLTEDELKFLYIISHNSCDGVVRPGTFWDEEFSTGSYRVSLSELPYLRLTGFEGEYYRNMERLPHKSIRTYQSWIRWEMIYRFAGNNFTTKNSQHQIEDRILRNLENLLGKGSFDLENYKKYYRKFVVPSYRSLQTNFENRFGFLVSPFADTNISEAAINSYPYLGKSLQFEVDMLNRLSPELAGLPNDYGFDFLKGEKFFRKIGIDMWQIFPPVIKHKLFSYYRKNHQSNFIENLSKKSRFISELIDVTKSADLPLNIDGVARRAVRGKLVLNLGFFLKNNETWLQW